MTPTHPCIQTHACEAINTQIMNMRKFVESFKMCHFVTDLMDVDIKI